MTVYVTSNRCRDIASTKYGKLLPHTFKIHKQRPARIEWFDGEVCVKFPTWALAQRAINQARRGNFTPWDEAVVGYFSALQSLM